MFDRSSKINVARKMKPVVNNNNKTGTLVVPQNSVQTVGSRMALRDDQACPKYPTVANSFQKQVAKDCINCPHCENMAKNFLYLESLIRTNYNSKNKCNICISSLKYLQFVNKSIMEVFGNFDSIVQAAKAFNSTAITQNGNKKQTSNHLITQNKTNRSRHNITHGGSTRVIQPSKLSTRSSKNKLVKKKSRLSKVSGHSIKHRKSSQMKSLSTYKFNENANSKIFKKSSKAHLKKPSKFFRDQQMKIKTNHK